MVQVGLSVSLHVFLFSVCLKCSPEVRKVYTYKKVGESESMCG